MSKMIHKHFFKFFIVGFFLSIIFNSLVFKRSEGLSIKDPALIEKIANESNQSNIKNSFIAKRKTFAEELGDTLSKLIAGTREVEVPVKKGDTISSLLQKIGVGYKETIEISKSINKVFDIDDLRPESKTKTGDVLIVRLKDLDQELIKDKDVYTTVKLLTIKRSPIHKVKTVKTDDGFISAEEKEEPIIKLVRKEGVIHEGASLMYISNKLNIPYDVIDKFYEIYSFDVDFERDIYPNDNFKIMYQELYSSTGEYLGTGSLIYANLHLHGRDLNVFRYEDGKGKVAYYDENGKGASKTLKKTPINGARISSSYGMRRHPILAYSKKHKGVDFAARRGTQIPAGGSGVVTFKGWKGGYGNYIKIRHNSTYSTAYAHMKAFKKGIRVGSRINQGQIIGYVGSTGLSTGPHLHYEIIKNGYKVNPLTVRLPSIRSLKGGILEEFLAKRDKINIQFAILNKDFKDYAKLIDSLKK